MCDITAVYQLHGLVLWNQLMRKLRGRHQLILSPSRSVGRIGQYRPPKPRHSLKRGKLRGELVAGRKSLHQCPVVLSRSGETMDLEDSLEPSM